MFCIYVNSPRRFAARTMTTSTFWGAHMSIDDIDEKIGHLAKDTSMRTR